METIHFEVGAKAARLIGRENITDSDGALMELIKNAYDADADSVYICFNMPFPYVPSILDSDRIRLILKDEDQKRIQLYYNYNGQGHYSKKSNLTELEEQAIWDIFSEYNYIIIADNGIGMTLEDVRTKWMYIGTSDKEINIYSPKGRVKTGAKGIGRFALDKLSLSSRMLTKNRTGKMVDWSIDWEQFENTKLLAQVDANLEEIDSDYTDAARELLNRWFPHAFSADNVWTSGTTIILHPLREQWTSRMFERINTNLKSINPLGAVDPFKVYVKNQYYPEYNFETDDIAIDRADYDYKIEVSFDGNHTLITALIRNEVDTHKRNVSFPRHDKKVSLKSFWERPYFQKEGYQRQDFENIIIFTENATEIVRDDPAKIRNVGPFKAEMYFVKSRNSSSEIIKKIKVRKRQELLRKFAGIKLYRDEFKVRPYGDDGNDWLDLGRRQMESPGGVGSDSGSWRVLPYQLIGQVKIGRKDNPALYDMANREGLTQNDEYHILVDLLQNSIHRFEIDRRGFYREYAKWYKDMEASFGKDANIRADVQKKYESHSQQHKNKENQKDSGNAESESKEYQGKYTNDEYEETIYNLMKENSEKLNARQLLQLLSSNGLILNTFFHEFKAIESQFNSRAVQLRHRLAYMEGHNTFHPGLIYDPYIIIDKMEDTDRVLSFWLQVSMDGMKKENLKTENRSISRVLEKIMNNWSDLLKAKDIIYEISYDEEEDYMYDISLADLYIIMNNFLLNSAYFLEREHNPQRKIMIELASDEEHYHLHLENNGPILSEKYSALPDRIFELGESSKDEGTGIGLWIMKETVERYNGTIMVSGKKTGFGLDIYFKKSKKGH